MEKYISKLIELVNDERKAEISAMKNEIKRLSPYQREKKGRAINNLKGKSLGKELGYNIIQYGRKEIIDTEINVGDLVLISKGNPLKSNLTGTVTEKGGRFIKISLEDVPNWAIKKRVRIDLYASDISFRRMEENLKKLSPYGKKALNILLKKYTPSKKTNNIKLNQFKDTLLNKSQKIAIENALNTHDFFLIHGPFGTGKTRTLIELIYQEGLLNHKILATGESNTSVDNLLEGLTKKSDYYKSEKDLVYTRLGHPQRVSKQNIKYSLAYKAEQHPMNEQKEEIQKIINEKQEIMETLIKPIPRYRRGFSDEEIIRNAKNNKSSRGIDAKTMQSMAKWLEINYEVEDYYNHIESIENEIIKDIIKNSDVILSTNSSAALEYIENIIFDVAIIDEASQASIPSVLIPISKAKCFILAGDHKQLPPTVISNKTKDFQITLFEKLIVSHPEKSSLLNFQYRMNEKLMIFPNLEFYDNKLFSDDFIKNISLKDLSRKSLSLEDKKILDNKKFDSKLIQRINNINSLLEDSDYPFLFLDTSLIKRNMEEHFKDSSSVHNKTEAQLIGIIVNNYLKWGYIKEDIGVISPYMDQVEYLKNLVPVEVKTVDGFQGREKEIIIISNVRSNRENTVGFLKDIRRLNVAITRSKRKLIIVGDSSTLKFDSTYNDLIDYCKVNDSFKVL